MRRGNPQVLHSWHRNALLFSDRPRGGAALRMRIEAMLNERIVKNLNGVKALLAAAGLVAVANKPRNSYRGAC